MRVFGFHRLPFKDGWYIARIDVDAVCDAPRGILQQIAQERADRAAKSDARFYRTHVLDTPEGKLAAQREMCRRVGYTIEHEAES